MRGVAPNRAAADALARKLRDRLERRFEAERRAGELAPKRQPLDLNALFPIPHTVLAQGSLAAGAGWMWENWGTPAPIRKVSFAWEKRRLADGRAKALAVYHFLSEEWSPWIALRRIRARWPHLSFALRVDYPETIEHLAEPPRRLSKITPGRVARRQGHKPGKRRKNDHLVRGRAM